MPSKCPARDEKGPSANAEEEFCAMLPASHSESLPPLLLELLPDDRCPASAIEADRTRLVVAVRMA